MRHKVEALTEFLTKTIAGWNCAESITADPRSEYSSIDPNFALVIDVYHRGKIPGARLRRSAFGHPGAFESAGGTKDRFFLNEIPIRVEYKDIRIMEGLVSNPTRHIKLLKNTGTYPFFRLVNNRIIHDKNGWVRKMRGKLAGFPEPAWNALYASFCSKMEHYLVDMGTASFTEDSFFLLVSEAGFLRFAAASVFMHNHSFEPSHRDIEEYLRALPAVPEGFWAEWDAILQKERDLPPQKRFEIARVLASSIFAMR